MLMRIKISKNEIDYSRRMSEEDRQREIKRQRAFITVRAEASIYRTLKTEPSHMYHNSNGDRISSNSMPISLC
jgi:hypothetical protein